MKKEARCAVDCSCLWLVLVRRTSWENFTPYLKFSARRDGHGSVFPVRPAVFPGTYLAPVFPAYCVINQSFARVFIPFAVPPE